MNAISISAQLGERLPSNIKTVILFPPPELRIWNAIEAHSKNPTLPGRLFVRDMEQAVKIAYENTERGKICLLSPGFAQLRHIQGLQGARRFFKAFVRKLSNS